MTLALTQKNEVLDLHSCSVGVLPFEEEFRQPENGLRNLATSRLKSVAGSQEKCWNAPEVEFGRVKEIESYDACSVLGA